VAVLPLPRCVFRAWCIFNHGEIQFTVILFSLRLILKFPNHIPLDRAIAQEVSRWRPTAAARVRYLVWSSGICCGQSGAGQDFSEYFGFPCQYSFHQLLHNHRHLSSGDGTIGQKWPQYKGLSPTPLALQENHIPLLQNLFLILIHLYIR
jgi:hypothetical protein